MDPFQIRIECLTLVHRLSASQQSIAKVVDFAIKHASSASDDIWDCLVSECAKSSLNARLNVLFLLDALLVSIVDPVGYSACESSASSSLSDGAARTPASSSTLAIAASTYLVFATRDLTRIVDSVVPSDDWDAVRLNASSVQRVLQSWKRLGVFDVDALDQCIEQLRQRKMTLTALPPGGKSHFSQAEILRRMEEDRERHKRLRERAWILPGKSFIDVIQARPVTTASGLSSSSAPSTAGGKHAGISVAPPTSKTKLLGKQPDALQIEFDDMWETVSDLNDDDVQLIEEDDRAWWGGAAFAEKQRAKDEQRHRLQRADHSDGGETRHPPPEARQQHAQLGYKAASPTRPRSSVEPEAHGGGGQAANRWRKIGSARKTDDRSSTLAYERNRRTGHSGGHRANDRTSRRAR